MSTPHFTLFLEHSSSIGTQNLATRKVRTLKELKGQGPGSNEVTIPPETLGTFITITEEHTPNSAAMIIFCDFGGVIYSERSEMTDDETRKAGACFEFEGISII